MATSQLEKAFTIYFNLADGLSNEKESSKRYLSEIKHIFMESEQAEKYLTQQNPLVYEFYELGMPEDIGDLAFGTSITYPGKIGHEYFMTKGHFHPGRFAHRSINIGDKPLSTFFCFRADAGHDYKTIATKGFRKVVVEKNGKPQIMDNPGWK
jgi:glucose-6-phosphate isomerase